MSIRYVLVEVRKNLRCANVFLEFQRSLVEEEKNCLKIRVDSNALYIEEPEAETSATVTGHFTIDTHSMSSLTVEKGNASFRVTIDNITNEYSTKGKLSCQSEREKPQALVPCLQKDDVASIHCKNCDVQLTAAQKFRRVLEFPSNSMSIGDFFCHPGHADFGQGLVPRLEDFFYGFHFIVISPQLLQDVVNGEDSGGSHRFCGRCLRLLGETLFNGQALKMWSECVCFKLDGHEEAIKVFNTTTTVSQLLHKICYDHGSYLERDHPMIFCKVLLESSASKHQRQYIIMQVLEKDLEVLRNCEPLNAYFDTTETAVVHVELEKWKAFKLLYHVIDGKDVHGNGEDDVLLNSWIRDLETHSLKISPVLFAQLLGELEVNALLLPLKYRQMSIHQVAFKHSYVFCEP